MEIFYYMAAVYYLCINIITVVVWAADKVKAKTGARRISEMSLLILSFIGGAAGAFLVMKALRHKTNHFKFRICVPLSLMLHMLIAVYLVYIKGQTI
jgi:uncharacterized membrane protein YsdA (DUF1294 family)